MAAYSENPDKGVQHVQAHGLGSDLSFNARRSPGNDASDFARAQRFAQSGLVRIRRNSALGLSERKAARHWAGYEEEIEGESLERPWFSHSRTGTR
jgi:hypothetical protein